MSACQVLVSGTFHILPNKCVDFIAAWNTCREITLKEAGCIVYDVSIDRSDSTKFVLYEEWENVETLAAHGASAHVKLLIDTAKPWFASPPIIKKFKISGTI
jgi:quinol monooxygenase YgiN